MDINKESLNDLKQHERLTGYTNSYENKDLFNKFYRFNLIDPYTAIDGSKEYIFFTKPDLYLFKNEPPSNVTAGRINPDVLHPGILLKSNKIKDIFQSDPHILLMLTKNYNSTCGHFNPLLTNSVVGNLDLPGVTGNYIENSNNMYGALRSTRMHSLESNNEYTFSLEFRERRNMDIYKLLSVYDEYINLKSLGYIDMINMSNASEYNSYRMKMLLDRVDTDTFSIYRFIVDSTGENILHYAKLWGCTFANVPRDSITDVANGGEFTLGIDFRAELVADLDPTILFDFNEAGGVFQFNGIYNNQSELPYYKDIFNKKEQIVDNTPTGIPYVIQVRDHQNKVKYMLKWKK